MSDSVQFMNLSADGGSIGQQEAIDNEEFTNLSIVNRQNSERPFSEQKNVNFDGTANNL